MSEKRFTGQARALARFVLAGPAALMLAAVGGAPARGGRKPGHNTPSRVGVAIGYKNKDGWTTEGWWPADPQKCLTLLKGALIARYYYVYAEDYNKGGSWGGKSMMCTHKKIFTIRGIENCEQRGYLKTGFLEVDTGEQTDWTISLSGEKTTPGQQ